ncbi:MAG: hypothetical protein PVF17_07785 [Ignavibacteria bacterium]|jgi:hypothetical protein
MNISETLNWLNDWKKLPAYKAEPRVDFIVAGALPEIIKSKYNCNIKLIIPELPIRIGTIYKDLDIDKSYKVDFYLYLENGKHLFIEFKTDSASRRVKQDKYLLASQNVGMKEIIDGIIKINSVTNYKTKYSHLIKKLLTAGLISEINSKYLPSIAQDQIEILYIQPKATSSNEMGFDEISKLMSESDDKFYKMFSKILFSWSID